MRSPRTFVWASLLLGGCAAHVPTSRTAAAIATVPAPVASTPPSDTIAPEPATESVEHAVAVCMESWSYPTGQVCRSRLDDPNLVRKCTSECRAVRRQRLSAVGEEPVAGRVSDDAVDDALDRCIVDVVESSRPPTCKFAGRVAGGQQWECDSRCETEARAEIRRRIAPREPLSPMPKADGM